MINPNFWQLVEKKLKFVLYSDTDSIFLNIPTIQTNSIQEAIERSKNISENINNIITKFTKDKLLPRLGISPEFNNTFYKTEMIADSIIFLGTKKTYAYKLIASEGKIIDPPVIEYTGIDVVRTNVSKFTRDLIKILVEKLALNKNSQIDYQQLLKQIGQEKWLKLKSDIENFDFKYIGIPSKWGLINYVNEPATVISMRLYNSLVQKQIFTEGSSGYRFPIVIKNIRTFNEKIKPLRFGNNYYIQNTPITNLNYLSVPYNYEKNRIKEIFEKFTLNVDAKDFWNILYSTSTQRVSETIKSELIKN